MAFSRIGYSLLPSITVDHFMCSQLCSYGIIQQSINLSH